jgi:tetratricopeptide (TPR) repeat protein
MAFGDDHFHVSSIHFRNGILETNLNQFEKAQASFDAALKIRTTKFGADSSYVADILHPEGILLKKQGELQKAIVAWRKAFEIRKKTAGLDHKSTLATKAELKAAGELV